MNFCVEKDKKQLARTMTCECVIIMYWFKLNGRSVLRYEKGVKGKFSVDCARRNVLSSRGKAATAESASISTGF